MSCEVRRAGGLSSRAEYSNLASCELSTFAADTGMRVRSMDWSRLAYIQLFILGVKGG
jgi:hypothetical protein